MKEVIKSAHESTGHGGRDTTQRRLRSVVFAHGLMTQVRQDQRGCMYCTSRPQTARKLASKPPLRPIITSRPFEKIFFDVTYLPPDPVTGDRYLVVLVDHYSKFCWVKALATREPQPIADMVEEIFSTEGIPDTAVSDNGTELKNQIMAAVLEGLGVKERHGYPEHPQTQGVVERRNGFIKTTVRSLVHVLYRAIC